MVVKIDTENPSYQRDMHSKALISNNKKELSDYMLKRNLINNMKSKDEEINSIKEKLGEIDSLKTDLQEIKTLLNGLVNK
jgi:hypothetical protein